METVWFKPTSTRSSRLDDEDVQVPDRRGKLQNVRRLEESRLVTMDREILDFIVAGNDAICGEEGRISAVDCSRQRTRLVVYMKSKEMLSAWRRQMGGWSSARTRV